MDYMSGIAARTGLLSINATWRVGAALTSLLAWQFEHVEQRVRNHIKLLWLKACYRAPDQPATVDGSHLVDQCIGILFQGTGRSNTNPERLGVLDEPCRERDHERRRMLSVEQRLGLNDQDGASLSQLRIPSRIEIREPDFAALTSRRPARSRRIPR